MVTHVGVLMGGWGEERDISLKTGEGVVTALRSRGHHVTPLLADAQLDRSLREATIDVAFLALHGRMGEDGKVQGLLEVMGIPYTGSGVLASALAMNKPFAKKLFRLHNIPTPVGYSTGPTSVDDLRALHGDLGFPCIVKPACGGSSVGVRFVQSEDDWLEAIAQASHFGGSALVERPVRGREITVAVMDDRVLGSMEIEFTGETFDSSTKYQTGARLFCPPRLHPTRVANIEALALGACRALGCRSYARVDLIASERENDVVLEVNTLPGLTPMSLFPKIARAAGMDYETLCEVLLAQAQLETGVSPVKAPRPTRPANMLVAV